jgi:hypothetical protein
MTEIKKYTENEKEELKEVLIKNLPNRIKGGNDKKKSNVLEYQTVIALEKCKFINFNTKERISFLVFDIDKMEDKTAKEHFKDINGLYDFISEKIGLEPTYILETAKGFHFAYHLKNHVYTNQKKAFDYLLAIKHTITKILSCDEIASHKLYGVWRNPLLHNCYYSKQINYELKDFKSLLPKKEYSNSKRKISINVKDEDLEIGKRNLTFFKYALIFAYNQNSLTANDIFDFLENINNSKNVGLDNKELLSISTSVFKRWQNGTIEIKYLKEKKDINEGAMNFPKMKNLTKSEYDAETKSRQKISAYRTLCIRDKEKNKNQLLEAKKIHIIKLQEKKQLKVQDAIIELQNQNVKVSISSISKLTGIDRKTVKKYYSNFK